MAAPWYVVVEGIEFEDVAIGPFPTKHEADNWMDNSEQVDDFVQEDCDEYYTAQFEDVPMNFALYDPVPDTDESAYPEHPLEAAAPLFLSAQQ